jgi:hypothetical protein
MKRIVLISLAWFGAIAAFGQFSIGWYTIGEGGGTSTNNQYTASGTIGHHAAGSSMTGGDYSLTGGFWALYAVSTPGAPALNIAVTTTNTVLIFWPSPSAGFGLQQNLNLAGTNWVTPSEILNDNGANKFIIVTPVPENRFYRLHHP